MTSSVIRKYALAALCGAAMFGVGQGAQAASTWTIIGGAAPSGTANYDTDPSHNNVISSPLAGNFVNDPLNGATILQAAQLGTTTTGAYNVSWNEAARKAVRARRIRRQVDAIADRLLL